MKEGLISHIKSEIPWKLTLVRLNVFLFLNDTEHFGASVIATIKYAGKPTSSLQVNQINFFNSSHQSHSNYRILIVDQCIICRCFTIKLFDQPISIKLMNSFHLFKSNFFLNNPRKLFDVESINKLWY